MMSMVIIRNARYLRQTVFDKTYPYVPYLNIYAMHTSVVVTNCFAINPKLLTHVQLHLLD